MPVKSLPHLLIALAALWLAAVAGPARAAPSHITAELLAESAVEPGGTVMLAIRMRPAKGWHGYWLNPGDAGLGMELDWSLPKGATIGEPRYPVPEVLMISGLMNHVYHGEFAILVELTLPGKLKPGEPLDVVLDAKWLACTDQVCVPEAGRLATPLKLGKPSASPAFDRWRARLPAPLAARAHFARVGGKYRLAIPFPASMELDKPHFFAADDQVIAYAQPQAFSRKGDLLLVELSKAGPTATSATSLNGVLRLNGSGDGLTIAAIPGPVGSPGTPLAAPSEPPGGGLLPLLAGALLGGLLLNIMPCVFPILSLKALSLARAGESERHARIEGMAYTAGVVLACLGLGAVLLGMRAAGEEVGWAFQLQEPGVVAVLLLLAVAITANFLALFEFAVPGFAQAGSARGAFATGLLAAFVATPCTGPFMAAAMGAALLLPAAPALALFAALGLGIALPFLALAFVPALRRRLPKPGAWMARFRRWMALPMGLTALALAWLASRVGGMEFALGVAVFGALMLAGLMQVGRLQHAARPAFFVALAAAVVPLLATVQLARMIEPGEVSAQAGVLSAQPFSEATLRKARMTGRPVFLYFTADWCLTCKLNEAVAIESEATQQAFDKAGVITMRGDWTRRDPEITRFLTAHGAAGVPLYLWYRADGGEPERLEQVLTRDRLVELAAPDPIK